MFSVMVSAERQRGTTYMKVFLIFKRSSNYFFKRTERRTFDPNFFQDQCVIFTLCCFFF